ncbi:MAG: NAD(P)-dependent oxidoreductase, partial [Hydrogenophaga sp.]|nr:NAD(P)-dependent oxidoreductase [Hydrogenophaga sp.]
MDILPVDPLRIGLIGFGEVGRIFGAGLNAAAAWDLKFADPAQRDEALAHAVAQDMEACDGVASLCARSTLLISAVTASNTLAVA